MTASTPPRIAATAARDVFEGIRAAAAQARNEKDFQAAATRVLGAFADAHSIDLRAREQYTMAAGRADAVYNRLIIEYEAPNSLGVSESHRRTAHAIRQARTYIEGLAVREKQSPERMLGVVLDGQRFFTVRLAEGRWNVDGVSWSVDAARQLLDALLALRTGRALLPEYLIDDFGSQSVLARNAVSALYRAHKASANPLAHLLFKQWQLHFTEVSGGEHDARSNIASDLAETFDLPAGARLSDILFAVHTHFCFVTKSIARLVMEPYGRTPGVGGRRALVPGPNDLRRELMKLETGETYRELGVANLVEADFFGWYLHAWNESLAENLSTVLQRLADYNAFTLEQDPYAARDLLKKLYHYLLPRSVRHALGEYYTPDWLASRLLRQLNEPLWNRDVEDPAVESFGKRILDPACGSGTFLILAIRALREHARLAQLSHSKTLEMILRSVAGIDLNPLAVLAARVGYVLSIADLLPSRTDPIDVPVYMADSILLPTETAGLFRRGAAVSTTVGEFHIPAAARDEARLSQLTEVSEEAVSRGWDERRFVHEVRARLGQFEEADEEEVLVLYRKLSELHREGRNGIWARILKNAVMPMFLGQFDYIVGNPPWINWENLPVDYRDRTAPLWARYGLTGQGAKLGTSRVDVSTLMTMVAADRFLKNGGKLGFLITQSVFKGGAGAGFRNMQVPSGPLRVLYVDDFTELQPFEGANNRTSAFVLQKGTRTRFPVTYLYWKKTRGSGRLSYDSSLADALDQTERLQLIAVPVNSDNPRSPWLTARAGSIAALRDSVLGASDYEGHVGVCTWANGVYWVEVLTRLKSGRVIVRNVPGRGKRDVPTVEGEVEEALLHPLVRAGDIQKWSIEPTLYHVLPYEPSSPRRAIPEAELRSRYPGAADYFAQFRDLLRARAGYAQLLHKKGEPYYAVIDIDGYTFAQNKVVWPNMGSDIRAAVAIGGAVPQHTVTLVAARTPHEAQYIAGMLNSSIFAFAAASFSMRGGKSFATPHLLENVRIPRFGSTQAQLAVADLAAKAGAGETPVTLQAELDAAAAAVWGLSVATAREMADAVVDMYR